MCELICGSEGTLAFITEIKLNLVNCPPKNKVVVAAHFQTLQEALEATVIVAMKFQPNCEIIDKVVLDCTKANKTYSKNRAFIEGDPAAILCVEFSYDDLKDCLQKAKQLQMTLENEDLGYHFPYLQADDINKLWSLRKAGLGLLANIPGDSKAIANVEDTAVRIEDLPNYIADFKAMMDSYNQACVYYAHAGAGELHLRPILNLKDKKDRADFRNIALDTAKLVKKYGGSLSGEHGDGIVRGEFLPLMIGEKNYQLKALKFSFDEHNITIKGKL
ncbi:MAG: FAD-linked oxidase C-terminal domain-containing protein [Chitinophagales bacterium]